MVYLGFQGWVSCSTLGFEEFLSLVSPFYWGGGGGNSKELLAILAINRHGILLWLDTYFLFAFISLICSCCLCQQGVDGIKAYGIDKLIQIAASQLSDQLPESREAARILLLELQTVYEKFQDLTPTVSEHPDMGSWENFCQSKLSPLSAQAVLRVTNIAREGLVLGSWHKLYREHISFREQCPHLSTYMSFSKPSLQLHFSLLLVCFIVLL